MPNAARLADQAQTSADAHGCPACPHPAVGPIVNGSADVYINGRPAARKGDKGVHAVCCGPNTFTIAKGSPDVYVNGVPLARMNDKTQHCGGTGPIIEGSPDVFANEGAQAEAKINVAKAALKILLREAKKVEPGERAQRSDVQFEWTHDVSSDAAESPAQKAQQSAVVEVQVLDPAGNPLAGWSYELKMPDGSVQNGQTDEQGKLFADAGTQKGQCTLALRDGAAT
jgi:uncharacterized Zn-binding protein involved in type VI secretion